MATALGDFFADDDLNNILSLINDNIFDQTPDYVTQVEVETSTTFNCDVCSKICASKGGLTRHKRVKHAPRPATATQPTKTAEDTQTPEHILHPMYFLKYVKECLQKLLESGCYPASILE